MMTLGFKGSILLLLLLKMYWLQCHYCRDIARTLYTARQEML